MEKNARSIYMLLFLGILLSPIFTAMSQWTQPLNAPGGAEVFAVNGTNLFGGTDQAGIFLSTNNGTSWATVNTGLPTTPSSSSYYLPIRALVVHGTTLFAGISGGGVYLSTNNGTNWSVANSGLMDSYVTALILNGNNLFAGTYNSGVFLSTNNGTSWNQINNRLTSPRIGALAVMGTNLFAGTKDAVFLSTDDGTTWTAADTITMKYSGVETFAVCDTNLFAGNITGIFRSANNAASWVDVNPGLSDIYVLSLAVSGSNLFAGTWSNGIYLSTNNGTSWTNVSEGLPIKPEGPFPPFPVQAFQVLGSNLIAGINGSGLCIRPLSQMITAVQISLREFPREFNLEQNYPNPFNPITTIRFQVAHSGLISLRVFDMLGREVTVLANEEMKTGSFERTFDGSNVSSGMYFLPNEIQ